MRESRISAMSVLVNIMLTCDDDMQCDRGSVIAMMNSLLTDLSGYFWQEQDFSAQDPESGAAGARASGRRPYVY